MKEATAWTEEVAFVACPYCEETNDIGSGVVWSNPETETCTSCGKEFLCHPPGSDE